VCFQVLQANFDPRVRLSLRLQAKATAAKLVQGLLEGRQDLAVHATLAKELEPAILEMVRAYVTTMLAKTEAKGDEVDADEVEERYQVS
jgi:hypothetical protein